MTITDAAKKVESIISDIILLNGCGSRYFLYEHTDGSMWKIRVADHPANPDRTDSRTISFVVVLPEAEKTDDEQYCSMKVSKKTFSRQPLHEFTIEDNRDVECGDSIEYLLSYVIE